jgi:hypothetical protein
MRLPQRPEQHVIETAAWRLLQALAPREWIVREVTERDYGIDCYIEFASSEGSITGDLMSVQLKGTKKLDWKSLKRSGRASKTPPIQTATANYWLSLPIPVFVFVADLREENIFFSPAKEVLRNRYLDLGKHKSIKLGLIDDFNLKSKGARALLHWFYSRERQYNSFAFHLSNLLSQVQIFAEFIEEHTNRDQFLEVEAQDHLQFRALYNSCLAVERYLDIHPQLESLESLYRRDKNQWKEDYIYLHESTLDYICQKLQKLFPALVRRALKMVDDQMGYWLTTHPIFYSLCTSGEIDYALKAIEERFSTAS